MMGEYAEDDFAEDGEEWTEHMGFNTEADQPDRTEAEPRHINNSLRNAVEEWAASEKDLDDAETGSDFEAAYQRHKAAKRALLSALKDTQPSGWQPFDTAPEDGSEILVWREDAGVFTAEHRPSACECCNWPETCGDELWFSAAGEDLTDDLPTHWMPLPPPPGEDTQPETTPRVRKLVEAANNLVNNEQWGLWTYMEDPAVHQDADQVREALKPFLDDESVLSALEVG